MGAVVWPSESHNSPFRPSVFTCKCSLVWLDASDIGFTWDNGLSLELLWVSCCPVWWGSCCLDLCVCPLHMLQQLTDEVDVGVALLIALGLGGSRVGQPASSPHHHPLDELSGTASASPPSVACSKKQGRFCSQALGPAHPHVHQIHCLAQVRYRVSSPALITLRAGSPAPSPTGAALMYCQAGCGGQFTMCCSR